MSMHLDQPIFLNIEETEMLTGFKARTRQIEWLRTKGWRFEINGNHRPIIARKYAEKMLGCGAIEKTRYMPNFAALQGA